MKSVRVTAALDETDLAVALAGPAPLHLALEERPARIDRLTFLSLLAGFDGVLLASFGGTLGTPLVEAACLALESSWQDGSALDLAGCFVAPLLLRQPPAALRRLLLAGVPVAPERLVPRRRALEERSPTAVRLLSPLVLRAARSRRSALAVEKAAFGLVMAAGDRQEGVEAFRRRRSPRFGW